MSQDTPVEKAQPPERPRALIAVTGVLVIAVIASVVGLVLLNRERTDQAALLAAGRNAQVAAEAAVVQMTTYDYRTVEADFEWVDTAGTDSFRSNFAAASADAITIITELEASARGTVIDSATTVNDAESVTVLLFVDQEITSVGEGESKIDQPRVSMDMVLINGEWLVDEVALNNLIAPAGS